MLKPSKTNILAYFFCS